MSSLKLALNCCSHLLGVKHKLYGPDLKYTVLKINVNSLFANTIGKQGPYIFGQGVYVL